MHSLYANINRNEQVPDQTLVARDARFDILRDGEEILTFASHELQSEILDIKINIVLSGCV